MRTLLWALRKYSIDLASGDPSVYCSSFTWVDSNFLRSNDVLLCISACRCFCPWSLVELAYNCFEKANSSWLHTYSVQDLQLSPSIEYGIRVRREVILDQYWCLRIPLFLHRFIWHCIQTTTATVGPYWAVWHRVEPVSTLKSFWTVWCCIQSATSWSCWTMGYSIHSVYG